MRGEGRERWLDNEPKGGNEENSEKYKFRSMQSEITMTMK